MPWIHKEESWRESYVEGEIGNPDAVYYGWVVDGEDTHFTVIDEHKWMYDHDVNLSFTDWLDKQCSDDWEVLKISRNFNNSHTETWVVFRKQVEYTISDLG